MLYSICYALFTRHARPFSVLDFKVLDINIATLPVIPRLRPAALNHIPFLKSAAMAIHLMTSLHDLLFLVTLCPLNDLKTSLSTFRTKSLCIAFWSNISLNGSSPLLWQIHHNLLCQPALGY